MTGTAAAREFVEIGDWWDQAACRRSDPALFYSDRPSDIAEAKRMCTECPVREECLGYALANDERHGVWGGLTPVERRESRDTLLTTAEIGEMLQVNRNTVNTWHSPNARLGAGFPGPASVISGRTVWRAEDVIDWARRTGRAGRRDP